MARQNFEGEGKGSNLIMRLPFIACRNDSIVVVAYRLIFLVFRTLESEQKVRLEHFSKGYNQDIF